jgi:hypothetical protein
MSCANICNREERKENESGNSAGRRTGNGVEQRKESKKDVDPPGCARTNSGVYYEHRIKQKEKGV